MNTCLFCEKSFEQNPNSDKKFCSSDCKRFYHNRTRVGVALSAPVLHWEMRDEFNKALEEGRKPVGVCPVCHVEFEKKRYWQKCCNEKHVATARRRQKSGLSPDAKSRFQKTPEERFWEKVDKNGPIPGQTSLGPCWVWKGARTPAGYGHFTESKKDGVTRNSVSAYVYSYMLKHGKKPEEGQFVCHACDNRLCVNPDHLWLGTRDDNMADCGRKGRIVNGKIAHKAIIRGNLENFTSEELSTALDAIQAELQRRKPSVVGE